MFVIEIHNFKVCNCWDCYLNRHPGVVDRTLTPYEVKGVKISETTIIYVIEIKE